MQGGVWQVYVLTCVLLGKVKRRQAGLETDLLTGKQYLLSTPFITIYKIIHSLFILYLNFLNFYTLLYIFMYNDSEASICVCIRTHLLTHVCARTNTIFYLLKFSIICLKSVFRAEVQSLLLLSKFLS